MKEILIKMNKKYCWDYEVFMVFSLIPQKDKNKIVKSFVKCFSWTLFC